MRKYGWIVKRNGKIKKNCYVDWCGIKAQIKHPDFLVSITINSRINKSETIYTDLIDRCIFCCCCWLQQKLFRILVWQSENSNSLAYSISLDAFVKTISFCQLLSHTNVEVPQVETSTIILTGHFYFSTIY